VRYDIDVNGRRREVTVHRTDGRFTVIVGDRSWDVDAARVDLHTWSLLVQLPQGTPTPPGSPVVHRSREVTLVPDPGGVGSMTVRVDGVALSVSLNGRRRERGAPSGQASGPQRVLSPMPGKVLRVLVKPGDAVVARQPIAVIEAMKMENEIRAGRDGRVTEVAVRDGQSVDGGTLVAVVADS
jgi:biotin carboxyl carrier protein